MTLSIVEHPFTRNLQSRVDAALAADVAAFKQRLHADAARFQPRWNAWRRGEGGDPGELVEIVRSVEDAARQLAERSAQNALSAVRGFFPQREYGPRLRQAKQAMVPAFLAEVASAFGGLTADEMAAEVVAAKAKDAETAAAFDAMLTDILEADHE